MLEIRTEDGSPAYVRVTAFDDEMVTLDGNHPLAGQTSSLTSRSSNSLN